AMPGYVPRNRRTQREAPGASCRRNEHDAGNHWRSGRERSVAVGMSEHDAAPLFPSQPGDAAGARPTLSLLGQRESLSAGLRNAEGEMNAMDCRRMAGETFSEGFESRRRINVVEKIQ